MPQQRGRVAGGGPPAGALGCWRLEAGAGSVCMAPHVPACHPPQPSSFPAPTLPQTPENAKALLARGVAALPDSVKLWMQAARLEQSDEAKKRVLLRWVNL